MSSSREEVLRRLIDLWNAGEFDAFFDELGPGFVFTPDPSFPDADDYSGERLRSWMSGWLNAWDEAQIEVDEFVAHGSALTARSRWHVRATGSSAKLPLEDFTFVYDFDESGRPSRMRAFFDHAEAIAAAEEG